VGADLRLSFYRFRGSALSIEPRPAWESVLRPVAALACVLAPLLMALGIHSPVRIVCTLVLFALAPGVALLPIVSRRAARHELALVLATSLAVSAVCAQTMLWLGAWSPSTATWILSGACVLGIAAQLAIRHRGRPHGAAKPEDLGGEIVESPEDTVVHRIRDAAKLLEDLQRR